jgi:hypothetical protein
MSFSYENCSQPSSQIPKIYDCAYIQENKKRKQFDKISSKISSTFTKNIQPLQPFKIDSAPAIPIHDISQTMIHLSDNQIISTVLQSKDKGKNIEVEFKDNNGNVIAKECAERIDTVDIYKKELESKYNYLEKKAKELKQRKKSLPKDSEEVKSAEQDLIRVNNLLIKTKELKEKHSSQKRKWASNNIPMLFNQSSSKTEAREKYVPVLGNLRMQTVVDQKNHVVSSITRSAAVTDLSRGSVSLQELKDYSDLRECVYGTKTAEQALINRYGKESQLKEVFAKLNENLAECYGKHIFSKFGINGVISDENINQIIQERREILQSQVLQDLYVHFQSNCPQGTHVFHSRISLLNTCKKPTEQKNGFVLNEKVEALDMKAIYDEFDGKTIIFDRDCTGPFIDEKEFIHMPAHVAGDVAGDEARKTLHTTFMNVSVQRNMENAGIQKLINDSAVEKIEKWADTIREQNGDNSTEIAECLANLKNNLLHLTHKDSATAFATVDKFIELMSLMKSHVSVNCYGGKDRTGYVLASVTFRKLEQMVNGIAHSETCLSRWGRELLSDTSIAIRVIKDNVGRTVFKLGSFHLHLLSTKSGHLLDRLRGVAMRISHYAKLIQVILPPFHKPGSDRLYTAEKE